MIGRGERAPDFALPRGRDARLTRFYGLVGGTPAVLVFAGSDGQGARDLAAAIRDVVPPDRPVFLVSAHSDHLDDGAFHDPEAGVHAAYGLAAEAGPTVVVLDPNVRVAAIRQPATPYDAASFAAVVAELAVRGPTGLAQRHAPVLLVPGALDDVLCDRLIETWNAADPVATGVETMADGRHVEALDDLRKRRRDHVVADPYLQRELTSHVGRRVIPEIGKAFGLAVKRFEGFKIGCYTAEDSGFFAPHRDNLSQATSHRKFALSLNLNDDYEGGELCFPEYGRQRYRPDRGEALVFSGAHLHQVRPVSSGQRFVLLSFLY